MQIKTTKRYQLTPGRMVIINESTNHKWWRKGNPPNTVGGNISWYNHDGKTVWRLLRKLNIELLYCLTTLLVDMYPDKTVIQKDTCTPMFTAELFHVHKMWKHLNVH